MGSYLREADECHRKDAEVVQKILATNKIHSPLSTMSSSGLSSEELEVIGRFLANRTNLGAFREMATTYLDWVARLTK